MAARLHPMEKWVQQHELSSGSSGSRREFSASLPQGEVLLKDSSAHLFPYFECSN